MIEIKRKDELEETSYKIGEKEFTLRDLPRGRCKRLGRDFVEEFYKSAAEFDGEDLPKVIEIVYDKLSFVVCKAVNFCDESIGLTEEYVDEHMTNRDVFAFVDQFTSDNMMDGIAQMAKEYIGPFFVGILEVVRGVTFGQVVEALKGLGSQRQE